MSRVSDSSRGNKCLFIDRLRVLNSRSCPNIDSSSSAPCNFHGAPVGSSFETDAAVCAQTPPLLYPRIPVTLYVTFSFFVVIESPPGFPLPVRPFFLVRFLFFLFAFAHDRFLFSIQGEVTEAESLLFSPLRLSPISAHGSFLRDGVLPPLAGLQVRETRLRARPVAKSLTFL